MPDLLIELFSEEIPARMQGRARDDLKRLVTDGLVEAGLTYASAGAFSTPRRLVLSVDGLTAESRAVREERKGPSTSAPAAAVEGFLRSTGLVLEALERRADKKGETFYAVVVKPGRAAAEIAAEVLERVIRGFPWPKSMRWGAGSLRWVRPLQRILCVLSDEAGASVVPLTVDGIVAGNVTEGHRFMGAGPFPVHGFDDYVVKLKRAFVVLDSAEREAAIWQGAQNAAFAAGMDVVPDAGLLTEVAGLVEWPVVLMGRIGAEFLDLPPEVLQTSMREHQKFFSVRAKSGRIEGFVTVANIEAADGGAVILKGNQKVLSARLSDAKFFWENDLRVAKGGMMEWSEGLESVTFHNKLGSQAERVGRIATLVQEVAVRVMADSNEAGIAASIAKVDLRSAMVGEFPELQGVMGRYYVQAGLAGQPNLLAIADAARDHYSPLGPSDMVPTEPVSVAVALADKIDTLACFWVIEEKPTGSKDPFALRRAGLGVIRLLIENNVKVHISEWLTSALVECEWSRLRNNQANFLIAVRNAREFFSAAFLEEFGGQIERFRGTPESFDAFFNAAMENGLMNAYRQERVPEIATDLLAFLHDRLKVYLKDQGIRHDIIDACLAMPGNDDLTLLVKRAEALAAVMKTEDGANLLQGYKRANNILTQAEAKDGVEYSYGADVKFAETDEERALFAALDAAEAKIAPAMAAEDFAAAMGAMAGLRAPLDAFFTAVQVNADSPIIRRNRLNLLSRIRSICSGVADLTRIEG